MAFYDLGDASTLDSTPGTAIQSGDDIQDWLHTYWNSGDEVHVPSGTYNWDGTGFEIDAFQDSTLIGDGGAANVKIQQPTSSAVVQKFYAHNTATLTVKGFDFQGKFNNFDGSNHLGLSGRDAGATVLFEDVWRMDGQNGRTSGGGPDGAGFASFGRPDLHFGHIILRACRAGYWPNNGVYFKPQSGASLLVEDCYFENNNIDNLRVGKDATVRNCVFVMDERPPPHTNGVTGRGLRMRYSGHLDASNLDFWSDGSGSTLMVGRSDEAPTAEFTDIVVFNSGSDRTLDGSANWGSRTGSGWEVSGSNGDSGVPSSWIVCNNNNCTQPRTSPPSSTSTEPDPNGDESWTTDAFRIDGFEGDNAQGGSNLSEYSGTTSLYDVSEASAHDGVYGLQSSSDGAEIYSLPGDGLHNYPSAGSIFEYWIRVPSSGRGGMSFGYQSTSPTANRYRIIIEPSVLRLVKSEDGAGAVLADSSPSLSASTWYRNVVTWRSDEIILDLFDEGATEVASVTYSPGFGVSFQSGGVGFIGDFGVSFDSAKINSARPEKTLDETVGVEVDRTNQRTAGSIKYAQTFNEKFGLRRSRE